MRRILHTSDLHFGRANRLLVGVLQGMAKELKPDVVVVSGDLTQRARKVQFREAQQFLDAIDCPKVLVPGNHDMPLYNIFARFLRPLTNYRKYISDELSPTYQDAEMVMLGINTSRSFMHANGSISDQQIEHARQFFCSIDPRLTKILVTHHPFDLPETTADKHLLRRARHAIAVLAACEADLYLAGHAHVPFATSTARRYKLVQHAALVVQAGTGVSDRTRSEPNSFNLITVDRPLVTVQHFDWSPNSSTFVPTTISQFRRTNAGWQPVPSQLEQMIP
jgi:3',5'-cyclic AMP phosphodiesterase CpdA